MSTPDFMFIENENERRMYQSAYDTINKLDAWGVIRSRYPDSSTGYMFSSDPILNKIMDEIDENYRGGHSGFSIGITMRTMQYIAKNGLEKFRKDYLSNTNKS